MPNPIKYTAGTETLALKKGNFYIGTRDVAKGPTSATGYYAGITPPANGYTIYLNKASSGPSIYVATGATDLITITNRIAGTNYTTSGECLNYFATQTDKMVFNRDYESIITSGLTFNVDAGFTPSYPTTGTTIYDITFSGNNGTLTNGPVFSSISGGSISFDGSDDYASFASYPYLVNNLTLSFWFKTSVIPTGYKGVVTTWTPSAPNSSSYGVQFKNDGTLEPVRPVGSNWNVITSTTNTTNNNWTNCSVVYNTSGTFLYINGSLDNSNAVGSDMNPPLGFRLGSSITNNFNWNGSLSNVQIYNRALSSSEVLQNYQSTFTRFLGENIVGNGLALYLDAGYYPSYSGTGTNWADISGNRNNGTLTNGPTFSANTIVFDGSDDYVSLGNVVNVTTEPFTLNAWFKQTYDGNYQAIITKGTGSGTGVGYRMLTTPSNPPQVYIDVSDNITSNTFLSNNTIKPGVWNNVLMVRESLNTFRIYINGILDKTVIKNIGNISSSYPLQVGKQSDASYIFKGQMSVASIYTKPLTPFDVYQNYNAQKSRFGIPDIVTNGLVLNLDAGNPYSYNPLNTGSTRWVDVANSTTGGTLLNGTYYSGGTMVFDGTNDYVNFGNNFRSLDLIDKSFSAWIFKTTNSQMSIIDKDFDTSSVNYGGWGFWIQSNNKLWWWNHGQKDILDNGPNSIILNSWTHVAVTYNASTKNATFYINGVLNSSITRTDIVEKSSGNALLVIGTMRNNASLTNFNFNGRISNVLAYNRLLSADEIIQNYNALKERYGL